MSRTKFKIIDESTGMEYKLGEGEMIVMNGSGVFFLIGGLKDYDKYVRKLSDVCPKYDVVWSS